jgi:hypothetical protein
MGIGNKLMHAWNAFNGRAEDSLGFGQAVTYGSSSPSRLRLNLSNERSIVSAIYVRLAVDFASIAIRHVKLDPETGRFKEHAVSGLNNCLLLEANIDQGARAFRQDIAMTMFESGTLAIVPVDTSMNPNDSGSYDIETMRVGVITKWMPRQVTINLYNDKTGKRENITLDKKLVAIVENPFYSVMNEANSTLQRLIRKLNLLDAIDEQTGSGKLDLIIQLPYVIKTDARRKQAENRREDIEFQLKDSKYGIAYTDGTEKITQLNRPAENNLMGQIEYLIQMLYGQLGLTPEIMNGTADEKAMLNYLNRTIEPLLDAVCEAMKRTFLTKTARTQGHSLEYYRDPFKLVPLSELADVIDKLSRNEIVSPNELRPFLGFMPSTDPKADELRNSNMPAPSEPATSPAPPIQEGDSHDGT